MEKQETRTYVLGRFRERNFIGRLPRRTMMAIAPGGLLAVILMASSAIKESLVVAFITVIAATITHFQRDGRSIWTMAQLWVNKIIRKAWGEDTTISGPESLMPAGQFRFGGLLAATEMLEAVDINGYPYGIIVNPVTRTATVVVSAQLTGEVLSTEEEKDRWTAQWGRCEALWASSGDVAAVVSVVHSRPATGMLALREVNTIIDDNADPLAQKIVYERAEILHNHVQEQTFHIAFTVRVSMSHNRDFGFVAQLSNRLQSFYTPLATAGIQDPTPMTAADMTARAHEFAVPGAEEDLEQLRVAGEDHGLAWRDAGPSIMVECGDRVFHDGAYSVAWEMVAGPSATFEQHHLAPLFRTHDRLVRKTNVLVYRPYPPGDGQRLVDQEHRDALVSINNGRKIKSADAELRLEATEASRQALARGARYGRRSMYVMATYAPGEDQAVLETDIKDLGAECQVMWRRMDGMHDAAFQYCLGMGALPFGEKDK